MVWEQGVHKIQMMFALVQDTCSLSSPNIVAVFGCSPPLNLATNMLVELRASLKEASHDLFEILAKEDVRIYFPPMVGLFTLAKR